MALTFVQHPGPPSPPVHWPCPGDCQKAPKIPPCVEIGLTLPRASAQSRQGTETRGQDPTPNDPGNRPYLSPLIFVYKTAVKLEKLGALQSELGAALFRNTAATVSIVEFNKTILDMIPKLLVAEYTQQTHEEALAKLYGIVDDFKQRGFPEVTRSIIVRYLSLDVSLIVKDLYWEVALRLATAMKTRALGKQDGIPLLKFELWFEESSDEKCGIQKSLLDGACTCRGMVMDMLEDGTFDSITAIKDALTLASESLLRCDPFWVIEQAWMTTNMTESMTVKLQQLVMATLPSTTHPVNEDTVLNELRELEHNTLCDLRSCDKNQDERVATESLGIIHGFLQESPEAGWEFLHDRGSGGKQQWGI